MNFFKMLFGEKKDSKARLQDKVVELKRQKQERSSLPGQARLDSSEFQDKLYQNTSIGSRDRRAVTEYSTEIYKYLRRIEVSPADPAVLLAEGQLPRREV